MRRPLPPKIRWAVLRRDDFTCQYCGAQAPEVRLHVDHMRSLADGGDDDTGNLLTACQDCNLGKGRDSATWDQDSLAEYAIAARMIEAAYDRFGVEIPSDGAPLLISYSLMNGPRPSLIEIIAAAETWEAAERALAYHTGVPTEPWVAL